ncbi:MAG: hypothetical protein ACC662_01660 [Planctomycetota bacterium]
MRLPLLIFRLVLLFGLALLCTSGLPRPAAAGDGETAPAACPPADALDRILLLNGRVFEGRIIREDESGVVLGLVSSAGGEGRMRIPRAKIGRIERARDRAPLAGSASVRNAWYLLRSGGRTVGTRRLTLRKVRDGSAAGWRLEEHVLKFARGPSLPATQIHRMETTDLAFFPLRLHYREVGEASSEPGGPRRYERILTGAVVDGVWTALVREGGTAEQRSLPIPTGLRGPLGTREPLLRGRKVGLRDVTLYDPAVPGPVTVRAGYTGLDLHDEHGAPYDEFVWEEHGTRRRSRFLEAEVLAEEVAEDVVAVPVTRAQAEAAEQVAGRRAQAGTANRIRLPDVGLSFRLPGDTWKSVAVERAPLASGWRKVAAIESRFHVADVRVEWDPTGAQTAPGPEEAEASLLQRLRVVAPKLEILEPRRSLDTVGEGAPAWRMTIRSTLKGEVIRTVVVWVDRGDGRALFLAAVPEMSWPAATKSIEKLVASIRVL